MTTHPLGAQISHMLKDRGVQTIFGIPGVHNQELYRGIEEAGLTHVLARHEQGAGFMADGYARASGKTGVCYVITGPGLCNIMTPMGQAYSDSVPMLVISSCLDETVATRGQLHQMKDQRAAAEAVCEWSEEARTPEAAYKLIDRALSSATGARQRPKHVTIPIRALQSPAKAAPRHVAPGVATQTSDVRELVEMINGSKKPLFIFGGGCVNSGQHDQPAETLALEVSQLAGAACFTSYAGRGLIPPEYPLLFGSLLGRPDSAEIIASADLVIAFGTDLAEVDLWRKELGNYQKLIVINTDHEVLSKVTGASIGYDQEVGACLSSLRSTLKSSPRSTEWTATEVATFRSRMFAQIASERVGLPPIIDALRMAVRSDTMIYSDMTQFAYAALELWDMAQPGHWHHPSGFGTLGYALPAAIGGAVARAGLPTMAIAGDYGFQYTVQELATAVELGLPLPIILWDNGKLGEIEESMTAAQIAPNAVLQRNPDFLKLAQAYGARAVQPETLGDLAAIVSDAFAANVPTLIRLTPEITTS